MKNRNVNNKCWLILSYCSNIDGSACAQHLDDRLPYFRQQGIDVILLSGMTGRQHSAVSHGQVPSIAPSGIRFELRHMLRKHITKKWVFKFVETILLLPILPFYLLEKIIIDIESEWSWFFSAAFKGRRLVQQYAPDVIYSTGGSASAHLAAFLIARKTGISWVAEFQDPLVHDDWIRSRRALKIFERLERLICRHASAVIFLTQAALEKARSRTNLGNRGHVVFPGARSRTLPDVPCPLKETFHFIHLGSLSGSRNLEIFLEALKSVLDANPDLQKDIRVDLYGNMDRYCRANVISFSYPGVITDHGKVPRKESLVAMMQSDCLLLVQNTQAFSEETIPSKVYEYFFSKKPILALTFRNSELSDMLGQHGHVVVAADDVTDASTGIQKVLQQFYYNNESAEREMSAGYETKDAVERLMEISSNLSAAKDT